MKKNRIIVIADEGGMTWENLILIAVKRELEIVCQLVEAIRKLVITPMIVLLPDHSEMRNKIIYLGGQMWY